MIAVFSVDHCGGFRGRRGSLRRAQDRLEGFQIEQLHVEIGVIAEGGFNGGIATQIDRVFVVEPNLESLDERLIVGSDDVAVDAGDAEAFDRHFASGDIDRAIERLIVRLRARSHFP